MPYEVQLIDVSGYYDSCWFCKERTCKGCALNYTEETTLMDLLKACNIKSNDTLYSNNRMTNGKEVQLNVVWNLAINKGLFSPLASASTWKRTDSEE